ncbi:hypothetical protein QJS66_23275 [Kocuria rhizophila]|nr:hypothetical protein QJS66_23275 [Kocuria rhizophila]
MAGGGHRGPLTRTRDTRGPARGPCVWPDDPVEADRRCAREVLAPTAALPSRTRGSAPWRSARPLTSSTPVQGQDQ